MKNKISHSYLILIVVFFLASAFKNNNASSDKKSLELIQALEKVNGGWHALSKMKDVEFTYDYDDKSKKAKDISKERFIFNGEQIWGEYSEHKVNVMPETEGIVRQRVIDGKPEASLDGKPLTDQKSIGTSGFLRGASYYWFTMMYKLNDSGTIHKYLGTEKVNNIMYDKVSLTFENTGKASDDSFILYFNPKTHLVDRFYFSLPAFGVNDPVLLMELDYEKIDGMYVSTTRRGVFPNAKGGYGLAIVFTYSNIKFNNGFTKEDLSL